MAGQGWKVVVIVLLNWYVTWDVSYLTRAIDHIKITLGSTMYIGILILAAIVGVTLIRQVVKYFIR